MVMVQLAALLRKICAALVFLTCVAASIPAATAQQQEPSPATESLTPAAKGDLLIHGNYCGVGSREGRGPIDELDAACQRHDACAPAAGVGIPSCECNARLREESTAIAEDPSQTPEIKLLASATASAAAVMVCMPGIPGSASLPAR